MKSRKFGVLMVVLMLLTVFAVGCGGQQADEPAEQNETVKVGFVYIGVPGDAGWTLSHDQGRQYLVNEIPQVETVVLENVPEGADAERNIEQLAQEGCKVIAANSFGYGDAMLEVAKRYPDITFLHCSGQNTAENVSTYFGRIYQPRYLSGMVAGEMTENNTLGYVAAFPIPEVVRGINAFTLGAQSVNPDVTVKVVWTNTWFDPTKEKEAAKSLLESGCDIIAQHQDTASPQQAAEEAGKLSIGYNTDMSKFAPNANLTSPVWNWGPYYVRAVQGVIDGTWKSESYWGGLDDGIVALAPLSDKVSDEIKQQVEEKQKLMHDKDWDVFTGPITAQDGTVKISEGESMSDADMLSIDWFVEGVEGTIE
ncbi:MAG: BMP family ABC transporter substrate-binding protein [Bacillota bacterium]|nr:BMP family ABC transporter substrate-binding protein [Bacillota bacterium]